MQKEAASSSESDRAVSTKAHLTNLDKVYWPEEGYTKGDMIRYYQDIADFILPYLKDRPQSLHRHPQGITEESFFQKDVQQPLPPWIKTVKIKSESKGEINYLVCQDKDDLAYINNLGCIEINPWNSRVKKEDYPDYLVLDLDPVDVSFPKVIEVALAGRKVVEKLDMEGWCKTSGGRGLHIYIPLGAKYHFDQVKDFSKLVCLAIQKQVPGLTSLERSPDKRQKLVYLDYLQNKLGATMALVYSLRPKPKAPVSMPLEWKEVNRRLDPLQFNLGSAPERLQKKGDLWKKVLGSGIDMKKSLKLLERYYT